MNILKPRNAVFIVPDGQGGCVMLEDDGTDLPADLPPPTTLFGKPIVWPDSPQAHELSGCVPVTQELLDDSPLDLWGMIREADERARRYREWFESLSPDQQAAERLRRDAIDALYHEPSDYEDDDE